MSPDPDYDLIGDDDLSRQMMPRIAVPDHESLAGQGSGAFRRPQGPHFRPPRPALWRWPAAGRRPVSGAAAGRSDRPVLPRRILARPVQGPSRLRCRAAGRGWRCGGAAGLRPLPNGAVEDGGGAGQAGAVVDPTERRAAQRRSGPDLCRGQFRRRASRRHDADGGLEQARPAARADRRRHPGHRHL